MMEVPQVHYATSSGADIAYQVYGEGPPNLVAIPLAAQNIELAWEWPAIRHMLERFGSFSRYLCFDKRGTGASDRNIPVPEIDQRVDDLRAVMDDAGIDRAFLFGVSEGGPMTLLFAATYPDRVDGVILESSGARLIDRDVAGTMTLEQKQAHNERMERFIEAWGTPGSLTADLMAPSLAGDAAFRKWHERYERNAASRENLRTLFVMNGRMDAREVLGRIDVPVLIIHRVDDPVVSIERARETAAGLKDVRLVELPGVDHFTYAADADTVLDEIERFVTGHVTPRAPRSPGRARQVRITSLGGFSVEVDGEEVPGSAWGSRRARTLLKRLVVARGWPVTRDELIDLLWPDEFDMDRLLPRLSVQLSTVRRILGGGVVADRSTIRLDTSTIAVDLVEYEALRDDREIVDRYAELLPDDRGEPWCDPLRVELGTRFAAAARRLVDVARSAGDTEAVAEVAARMLAVDPFDESAHRLLVAAHRRAGRHGSAEEAHRQYVDRMAELGVPAAPLAEIEL